MGTWVHTHEQNHHRPETLKMIPCMPDFQKFSVFKVAPQCLWGDLCMRLGREYRQDFQPHSLSWPLTKCPHAVKTKKQKHTGQKHFT